MKPGDLVEIYWENLRRQNWDTHWIPIWEVVEAGSVATAQVPDGTLGILLEFSPHKNMALVQFNEPVLRGWVYTESLHAYT